MPRCLNIAALKDWLIRVASDEVKHQLEPIALAAEVIESQARDRDDYFMTDDQVRGSVFMGAKWQAGMVLVAGDRISDTLITRLSENGYAIYSAGHAQQRNRELPRRETGAIYFLQLMVRYAMIWGMIPAGQDHEMGHFLEQDFPGAMIVQGELSPLEGLLLLALMKMGCPAIVDSAFTYDIGPRVVAEDEGMIMQALGEFPNMRVRIFAGEAISLPEGADTAFAQEKIVPVRQLTGLLQLRPGQVVSEVLVEGDESADQLAVIIEIADEKLDLPISAYLEAQAVKYGSLLHGVQTRRDDTGDYVLEVAEGVALNARLLGEVIHISLRRAYPRLGAIRVRIAFGQQALRREFGTAVAFNYLREAAIAAEHEETIAAFTACIDCQPFSHNHVCIITPDRPPMCGRHRNEIRACALWGMNYRPWTRRNLANDDLQYIIEKGDAIDEDAGEWEGVNAAVRRLTGGKLERVRIHSVFDAPHTSCGCFGALAFRIPGTDWIGVMERSYAGVAPGDLSWTLLANQAGGKQSTGVTGITFAYLTSPKAFAGDGGLAAVKWVTRKVMAHLPPDTHPAVEDDASTIDELHAFFETRV